MRRRLRGLIVLGMLVGSLAGAAAAQGDAQWRLEQPPPPPGARFKVPLGAPGDLEFYAPNAGLLSVEGNSVVPRGLYFYDGSGWRVLSTVCGDTADTSRIAWAGPDEFWVVTQPSFPRSGSGLGLCHFKNGQVIGSYSTPLGSPDPFAPMDAAACNGPNDCWFGGAAAQDPSGARAGSFHIHWDGTNLTTVYGSLGRGVSDLTYFQGHWYESAFVGAQREDRSDPVFVGPDEPYGPTLLRQIGPDKNWDPVNFFPDVFDGVPPGGTELLAAASTSSDLWFGGGGAASGPQAPANDIVPRLPVAAHLRGYYIQELQLDPSLFTTSDRFADVAPVPGTTDAWVADQRFVDRASTTAKAKVALLHYDGSAQVYTLPSAGAGRGSAAKVACPAQNDCWMVTSAGWIFHYTDGTHYPLNTDPSFASTINDRPNEAAAQFVADLPPPDTSLGPTVITTPAKPKRKKIPPLIQRIQKPKVFPAPALHGYALVLKFYVTRKGKVQLLAYHHNALVAKTRLWSVRRGWATLRLLLFRDKWPTSLAFVLVEKGKRLVVGGPHQKHTGGGNGGGGGGSNTISTAPDTGSKAGLRSGIR